MEAVGSVHGAVGEKGQWCDRTCYRKWWEKKKALRSYKLNTFNKLFLYECYIPCTKKHLSLKSVFKKASQSNVKQKDLYIHTNILAFGKQKSNPYENIFRFMHTTK